MAAALACGGFTFLLGGGLIEMFCAFVGAGIGNFIRCKLSKHHFTLFLCIASSVSAACLVYAGLLKAAELLWAISIQHEAGYICAMLFIIPGFLSSQVELTLQIGHAFWHGTTHVCTDYCFGSYNVCMDHGVDLRITAGGFSEA